MSARRGGLLSGLGVALLVAAVFAGALRGGFVYDDYWLVLHNPSLREPGPLGRYITTTLFAGVERPDLAERAAVGEQYWRPFAKLAILVQYRLFGLDPRPWHATSVLLHLLAALLALRWLRARLAGSGGGFALAAALAAGLWAVHPTRVEAVAWVSGSMDLWMGLWVLAGLWAWDARRAVLAALCFALAVLTKETAFVVPFALAQDAWWRPVPGTGRRLAIVAAVLGAVVAVRLLVLAAPRGLALGAPLPAVERALACLGLYVGRALALGRPSTQIGLVSPDGVFDMPGWSIAVGAATAVTTVALLWTARRKARARSALADMGWFLLPLVPVLQIVPLGYTTLVAERFLYLPLLGVAALAARALRAGMSRGPLAARASAVGAIVVGVLFAVVTMRYIPAFRGDAALWEYEARLAPENPLLHLYRARAASRAGEPAAALAAALESYRCARLPDARAEAALVWATVRLQHALGRERATLAQIADFLEALAGEGGARGQPIVLDADGVRLAVQPSAEFGARLGRSRSFPSSRAVAAARVGRYAAAEAQLRPLLQRDRSSTTWGNLARVLACQERWEESLAAIAAGQKEHPGDAALAGLEVAIRRGMDLAKPHGGGATAADAAARARCWIDLGSTLLARRTLAPWNADPAPPAAIAVARAVADAADGDPAGAQATLAAARARDPDHAATYDAAGREIQRLAAPAGPDRSRVDSLFR